MKKEIAFGLFLGSTLGGLIPNIWGASFLSFSSIVFSALGGMLGIYCAFKMMR